MLNSKPYPQIKTKPYSKTITFLTWYNFPAKIIWGAHITFALLKTKIIGLRAKPGANLNATASK